MKNIFTKLDTIPSTTLIPVPFICKTAKESYRKICSSLDTHEKLQIFNAFSVRVILTKRYEKDNPKSDIEKAIKNMTKILKEIEKQKDIVKRGPNQQAKDVAAAKIKELKEDKNKIKSHKIVFDICTFNAGLAYAKEQRVELWASKNALATTMNQATPPCPPKCDQVEFPILYIPS